MNVNHNYSLNRALRYVRYKNYIVFANSYFHLIISKSVFRMIRSKDPRLRDIYRLVNPIFYLYSFLKDSKSQEIPNANEIKYDGGGYFHWLLNYLPYLSANSYIDIPFKVENRDNFIRVVGANPVRNIYDYYPSRTEIEWCRSELIQLKSQKIFSRKFLVLRKNKGLRYLTDSELLQEGLKKKGFATVYLEDFTFEEQIALFHDAEVIIAIHGAGLSNLVFCKDNVVVVELMPDNEVKWHFWLICSILNFNYTVVLLDVLEVDNDNRALNLKLRNLEWFHSL